MNLNPFKRRAAAASPQASQSTVDALAAQLADVDGRCRQMSLAMSKMQGDSPDLKARKPVYDQYLKWVHKLKLEHLLAQVEQQLAQAGTQVKEGIAAAKLAAEESAKAVAPLEAQIATRVARVNDLQGQIAAKSSAASQPVAAAEAALDAATRAQDDAGADAAALALRNARKAAREQEDEVAVLQAQLTGTERALDSLREQLTAAHAAADAAAQEIERFETEVFALDFDAINLAFLRSALAYASTRRSVPLEFRVGIGCSKVLRSLMDPKVLQDLEAVGRDRTARMAQALHGSIDHALIDAYRLHQEDAAIVSRLHEEERAAEQAHQKREAERRAHFAQVYADEPSPRLISAGLR